MRLNTGFDVEPHLVMARQPRRKRITPTTDVENGLTRL